MLQTLYFACVLATGGYFWDFLTERGQLLFPYVQTIKLYGFYAGKLRRKDGKIQRLFLPKNHYVHRVLRFLYRPLGGCVFCAQIWAAFALLGAAPPPTWIDGLAVIFFGHFLLRRLILE